MLKTLKILVAALLMLNMIASISAAEEEYTLPFCEPGEVTLTFMGNDSWYAPASYANQESLPILQEYEARTGVHINFEVGSWDQISTAIKTRMAAAVDLPDIAMGGSFDQVMRYADSGLILPLNDLIDKYAPDIKAMLENDPYVAGALTAPDGNIYCLVNMTKGVNDLVPHSPVIRQDWLDKLGLEQPATLDEWYTVLKAFKEQDPNGNGQADEIPLFMTDAVNDISQLMYAFGFDAAGKAGSSNMEWMAEDGKIIHTFTDPRYKELVTFVNKLYTEGLMFSEIKIDYNTKETYVGKNIVGAEFGLPVDDCVRYDALVPGSDHQMIQSPTRDDKEPSVLAKRGPFGDTFVITKDCENPEIAIKWMNYLWANKEGRDLDNYGIEGLTCVSDGEGGWYFSDLVLHNPDLGSHDTMRYYGGARSFLVNDDAETFLRKYSGSKTVELAEKLAPQMVDCIPDVMPTLEETDEYTSIWADLDTYIDESIARFITGEVPMTEWDNYVAGAKAIGLDRVIEIKQAQYDRFAANQQ